MLVRDFMVKKEGVVTCTNTETITEVIETLMKHNISALLVLDLEGKPEGIVTNTDLIKAYHDKVDLDKKVTEIMSKDLHPVRDTMTRDDAAKSFEAHHTHHALVVDKDDQFVGFISSFDIASEVAKDSRAWPWNRTANGKMWNPMAAH